MIDDNIVLETLPLSFQLISVYVKTILPYETAQQINTTSSIFSECLNCNKCGQLIPGIFL